MIDINNTGLVLEGGGFRGLYTSGVLRFFMARQIYFPYVIGVSMGACNAANYISRQPERNRIVNISFINDSRYMSYVRLITGGELFGMDFIFETIPRSIVPFDFDTFMKSDQKCITVVTDCHSGRALYLEKRETGNDYLNVLKASSSLPFIARPVHYDGRVLMDGGLSDSVPVRKSIEDGNRRNVLVLTRPRGYRKKRQKLMALAHMRYGKYRGLCEALENRHWRYNETMEFIDKMEENGDIFVIRPRLPLKAGRIERDRKSLLASYCQGFSDAAASHERLCAYLKAG